MSCKKTNVNIIYFLFWGAGRVSCVVCRVVVSLSLSVAKFFHPQIKLYKKYRYINGDIKL
jgi:hypothetical protein